MKKIFIIIATIVGVLLLATILVPLIFKDDIQAALDRKLANSLNAKVYYDADAFSLSLFKSFPDLSVTIGHFGLVGVGEFENDTLADIKTFNLTLDIMSVISGDQIEIMNVTLVEPTIYVLVLEDGTANYNITKETAEVEEKAPETGEPLAIHINKWEIVNGTMIYNDRSIPALVAIGGLNHSGSGDFARNVFDMTTKTEVAALTLNYDGVEYISNKTLHADIIMAIDLTNMKFTFKENKVSLNSFGFSFDGFISMPAEDIDMDITFLGKDINLASVLSLIPGVYKEYLDDVGADGKVSFNGSVLGTYNEGSMPVVSGNFGIVNGKVTYSKFPTPLEDIQFSAAFEYPLANLRETRFTMDKFHMSLDGEEITAYLFFKDMEDYYWDFHMNGSVNLDKFTQIIPIEDTELRGKITADLNTKGRRSDLEAEQYANLPTSGSILVADLYYSSPDLPQGFGISESKMTFDPKAVALTAFKGKVGKTDLNMSGKITNYLQYILGDSTKLHGTLDFYSALVDVNEWMVSADTAAMVERTDTASMEVVRVPEDIDFVLTSKIDAIIYDNLTPKDFKGKLIIRDGAVRMDKVGFNLLDGYFEMNGAYESAAMLETPLYNFNLVIKELSIPQAFKTFTTIQKFVPVAEKMNGKFSVDFTIGGALRHDMTPVYDRMNGAGLVEIADASVENLKVLSAISDVSKLKQSDNKVIIKDVIVSAEIKGGRLYIEPFSINIGGRKATVSGNTGIDGSIDYMVSMNISSGQIGQALNSALSSFAGLDNAVGKDITLNLGVTGTYDNPKVRLLGAKASTESAGSHVKTALTNKAKEEIEKKKEAISREVIQKKDSVEAIAKEVIEEKKEEVKEEMRKATEKAKDAVKDLFGKKRKGGGR